MVQFILADGMNGFYVNTVLCIFIEAVVHDQHIGPRIIRKSSFNEIT